MNGYTVALDTAAALTEALTGTEHEVLVTIDPAEAGAALDGDTLAILVNPPTTTHRTASIADHEIEVLTIGPVIDPVKAWPILAPVAELIAVALAADTTRFTLYQPAHGDPWPCTVTTTTVTTS